MPSTTIANFDAGQIPDVSDEANFHADATYVFEHMASDIIPGINANLEWMNAALTDAETIVDQVGTLTQNLATAPAVLQSDPGFGDFDAGQAVIGGAITIFGLWENGPGGAAPQTYTALLHVLKRAYNGGAAVTQILTTSGVRPIIYTRVGTGNPYVFSDWAASVYAETIDHAENLAAALAAYTLPEVAGAAGQLLFNPVAGQTAWSDVGDVIAKQSFGAVGTYAFLTDPTTLNGLFTAGATYAGSTLYPAGFRNGNSSSSGSDAANGSVDAALGHSGTAMTGTWQAMGAFTQDLLRRSRATLFLRIL